jgi:DNA-binding protein YbaB
MFDKLKQMKQLKEMQESIKNERVEAERHGVKIVINGRFEVESIELNPQLEKELQEKAVKECFNEAVRKAQMAVAQKFSGLL